MTPPAYDLPILNTKTTCRVRPAPPLPAPFPPTCVPPDVPPFPNG